MPQPPAIAPQHSTRAACARVLQFPRAARSLRPKHAKPQPSGNRIRYNSARPPSARARAKARNTLSCAFTRSARAFPSLPPFRFTPDRRILLAPPPLATPPCADNRPVATAYLSSCGRCVKTRAGCAACAPRAAVIYGLRPTTAGAACRGACTWLYAPRAAQHLGAPTLRVLRVRLRA